MYARGLRIKGSIPPNHGTGRVRARETAREASCSEIGFVATSTISVFAVSLVTMIVPSVVLVLNLLRSRKNEGIIVFSRFSQRLPKSFQQNDLVIVNLVQETARSSH